MVEDEAIQWLTPLYPLDSNHSYYNDVESANKLAANIITPVDVKVLRDLGLERWRSKVSEYSTKVMLPLLPFMWSCLF